MSTETETRGMKQCNLGQIPIEEFNAMNTPYDLLVLLAKSAGAKPPSRVHWFMAAIADYGWKKLRAVVGLEENASFQEIKQRTLQIMATDEALAHFRKRILKEIEETSSGSH
jgi:hypothetical protein